MEGSTILCFDLVVRSAMVGHILRSKVHFQTNGIVVGRLQHARMTDIGRHLIGIVGGETTGGIARGGKKASIEGTDRRKSALHRHIGDLQLILVLSAEKLHGVKHLETGDIFGKGHAEQAGKEAGKMGAGVTEPLA